MTAQEFTQIKSKIDSAKEKKARAEGALAKIEEQWKRDYGINSIDEAEEKIKSLDAEIEKDKEKFNMNDWDNAIKHLELVEKEYTAIGTAGYFCLNYVILPIRNKYNSGIRSDELYLEIMDLAI